MVTIASEATREGLGRGLVELAKNDPRVVVLCADLTNSLRLSEFEKQFPDRFIQVGIAEQNMISIAAGLAMAGKIPFACSYAAFSPGRTWDQIRVGVCYSKLPVKIIGGHTGLGIGENGAVHQALEDIALTTVLPEMTVISPGDSQETADAVRLAASLPGPVYIRVTKFPVIQIPNRPQLALGKVYQLKSGRGVAIITHGTMVGASLEAAEILKQQQIEVAVFAAPFIKPLDRHSILNIAQHFKLIITVEEHQITGGLGSLIAPLILETPRREIPNPPELLRIGIHDVFGESGTAKSLHQKYGLTATEIAKQIITRIWNLE